DKIVAQFAYYQEIERYTYTGASTLLEEVRHCYNYDSAARCTTATGPTSQSQAGIPPQALTVLRFPNGSTAGSSEVTFYGAVDSTGTRLQLPTRRDFYDYGATTLTRQVLSPYGSYNATNATCGAIGTNILDRVCYLNVYGSSNGLCSKSNNSTLCASSWFTYNAQGDMISKTVNTGHNGVTWYTLPTNYTYYANGALNTVTEPNGLQTVFSGMTCGSGAFPNSITTSPATWTTSLTWDCNGGVIATSKDGNGDKTTYTYADPFWRVTQVDSPWANGTPSSIYRKYKSPVQSETYRYSSGTAALEDVYTNLDGLGRLFNTQKADGSNWDTVSYQYDSNGRLTFKSNPCLQAFSATATCPTGTSYTGYDGLDRPAHVTDGGGGYTSYTYQGYGGTEAGFVITASVGPAPTGESLKTKQFQYNAFGQLTSVCELTTSSGSGNCAQASGSGTGYKTIYSYDPAGRLQYVYQNSQVGGTTQTRSFTYDLSGRVISEMHPETGTTSYSYDTQPSICWNSTSKGDLMSKTDGAGNVTCFLRDSVHRVTDAAGWKNSTWFGPCRRYRYDDPTKGVVTPPVGLTNYVGRM